MEVGKISILSSEEESFYKYLALMIDIMIT